MSDSSIWSINDRTLSGATSLGQSGPESDGSEEVLCNSQSSSITRALPSDCFVPYPGNSLFVGGGYPFAEMQSVYSTAPSDWTLLEIKIWLYWKWYTHKLENETPKILLGFEIQMDPTISARRPLLESNKKTCHLVDFAVSVDYRVKNERK